MPCGDGSIDVKGWSGISSKAPDFRHFSALGGFGQAEAAIALRKLIQRQSGSKSVRVELPS